MRRIGGFTLIELMTVLVIVGILAAIVIPQYGEAVISSRRTDAQALLFEVAQKQQQFFSNNNVFTANITSLSISSTSPDGFYGVTVSVFSTVAISDSYLLIATPVSTTPQANDSKCDTLTLNSLGTKGATGTLTVEECWRN
jgi:type IV pilus assembly protein PilE